MRKSNTKGALVLVGSIILSMAGGFVIGCIKEKMMNNKCSCLDEF